jgi:transposase
MTPLVTEAVWAVVAVVAPLLPKRRAQPRGGRLWVDDRATLNGFLYVQRSGVPWRMLPTELGYGLGVTGWQRRSEWPALSAHCQLRPLADTSSSPFSSFNCSLADML